MKNIPIAQLGWPAAAVSNRLVSLCRGVRRRSSPVRAADHHTTSARSPKGERPAIAIPDLRGVGRGAGVHARVQPDSAGRISTGGGHFQDGPQDHVPDQRSAAARRFHAAAASAAEPARGRNGSRRSSQPTSGGGRWMTDWSGPPVMANYLAFGYTAVQNGVLVLRGWLLRLGATRAPARKCHRRRLTSGPVDEARRAQDRARVRGRYPGALRRPVTAGTHIYFVSDRTGHKEIWAMDYDGKNQRQITHFNSTSIEPAISPDGTKVAFTSYARGNPGIFVFSVDPVRDLRFYNQGASVNSSPSFTPDGKQIVYSSSAGRCCRIFIANLDGSGFRPISSLSSIDTEPKVNPKTGSDMVFSSGRSGPEQVYRMNMDGADRGASQRWHGRSGQPVVASRRAD